VCVCEREIQSERKRVLARERCEKNVRRESKRARAREWETKRESACVCVRDSVQGNKKERER